jgi:hypothetical protein
MNFVYQGGVTSRSIAFQYKFDTVATSSACGNPAYHRGLQMIVQAAPQSYGYTGSDPINPPAKDILWSWTGVIINRCFGWV